jgi:transcription elongation factor GreA
VVFRVNINGEKMSLLKLKKHAQQKEYDELELLWPDAVADSSNDPDDLMRLPGMVARIGEIKLAERMVESMLDIWTQKHGQASRLTVARTAAMTFVKSEYLLKELKRLYKKSSPDFDEIDNLVGNILKDGCKLNEAVPLMDRFIALQPGSFLKHRGTVHPGVVESVNGNSLEMKVIFDIRDKTLDADQIMDVIILADDNFPSMLMYKPEALINVAEEDPIEFVIMALKSTRDKRCTYKDIKGYYTDLNGDKAWSKWWKKAREILKKASKLEMTGAGQPKFRLLKNERSFEDRQRDLFRKMKDPSKKLEFVLSYISECKKNPPENNTLLVEFGNASAKMAGPLLKTDQIMTLACLAVHGAVSDMGAEVVTMNPVAAQKVIVSVKDPGQMVTRLNDKLFQTVLGFVRKVQPDSWAEYWSKVMPRVGKLSCEMMTKELLASGFNDELEGALKEIVRRPTAAPDAICWLWRVRFGDSKIIDDMINLPALSPVNLLVSMLNLIDANGRMAAVSDDNRMREIIDKAHDAIDLFEAKPIRALLENVSEPDARMFKKQIENNGGIKARLKASIGAMLRSAHPEIYIESSTPWTDEGVYWTSEKGLQLRQSEFDEIVNEEIPAVAKQIGEAASHGDLSENSEYTAALEKRDQITSRATRIENELAICKVMDQEMINSEFVNIGTKVTAKEIATGKEIVYSFLGVWDSNPDNGILSYRAPIAMAFMGAKPGETVTYGEGADQKSWEIISIEPGI